MHAQTAAHDSWMCVRTSSVYQTLCAICNGPVKAPFQDAYHTEDHVTHADHTNSNAAGNNLLALSYTSCRTDAVKSFCQPTFLQLYEFLVL